MRARIWGVGLWLVGGCFTDGGGSGGDAATTEPGTSTGATTTTSTGGSSTTGEPTGTTDDSTTGSPEGQPCDPFAQDCPAGYKCAPWATGADGVWDADKCVPVTGDDRPGEPCTAEGGGTSGYDSCEKGAMCTGVGQFGNGVCASLCGGTLQAPTCSPGLACLAVNDGVLNLCVQSCDPLSPLCELADAICVPEYPGFVCVEGGGVLPYMPCEYANDCEAGSYCDDAFFAQAKCEPDTGGCCVGYCDLADPLALPCPPELVCTPFYGEDEKPPDGLENVGYCGDPPMP